MAERWVDRRSEVFVQDTEHPWADSPYGPAAQDEVKEITTARAILGYDIERLKTASFNIKRATPKNMERALQVLDDQIQATAENIDRVLNEYGDTDPRH